MIKRNAEQLLKRVNQLLKWVKAEVGTLTLSLKKNNVIGFPQHTTHAGKACNSGKEFPKQAA
ncbi:hypothetical protein [Adhaeribacter pallidiroseus]|uniref:Uncharacterized protein n=1 Tax=Adhaeribacter pallidiroseus TaxID=2072847 RepID=A0A369QFF4_9BACT|nr:hypothetical protein [Adhaeribacter pallidiroseus]RDC63651.1 hypothetical protein AHMF7616_02256 [Adhaeribacter pallidiroseus]